MTRRFPLDPLLPHVRARYEPTPQTSVVGDIGKAAAVLGIHRTTIIRWQTRGLDYIYADRAACTLGMHPCEIWDDWFDIAPEPDRQPCGTVGGVRHHRNAGTPLCAPCRRAKADYEKAWRERNPERERARLERSYAKRGKWWRKEDAA